MIYVNLEGVVIVSAFIIVVVICAVQNQLAHEQQEAYKVELEEYQEMIQEVQDTADTWKAGYTELQEEYSQALEYIEQLEYELEMR